MTKITGSGSESGSIRQRHGSPGSKSTSKCHGSATLLQEEDCVLASVPPTTERRYICRFSGDEQLYRCRIKQIGDNDKAGKYCVHFVDFGNEEWKQANEIFELPTAVMPLYLLEQECDLAYEVKLLLAGDPAVDETHLARLETVLLENGDVDLRLSDRHIGKFYRNGELLELDPSNQRSVQQNVAPEPAATAPQAEATGRDGEVLPQRRYSELGARPKEKKGSSAAGVVAPVPTQDLHVMAKGQVARPCTAEDSKVPLPFPAEVQATGEVPVEVAVSCVESTRKVWVHLDPPAARSIVERIKHEEAVRLSQPAMGLRCMTR